MVIEERLRYIDEMLKYLT